MMKTTRLLIAIFSFVIAACSQSTLEPDRTPAWLTQLITDLKSQPPANPPALAAKYEFQGATVYFVPARCCDIPSTLYRVDGSVLCHPDGGLTGKGDGLCPTFFAERKNEQIVWRDTRSGS